MRVSRYALTNAAIAAFCLVASSGRAHAQDGRIQGIVLDSAGQPIGAADVSIQSRRLLAKTDDSGRFSFARLQAGQVELDVRRLGFQPTTVTLVVTVVAVDSVSIRLATQVAVLSSVDVTGAKRRREGVEDFYRRRSRGMGVYFTRADILARRASKPSDMLRTTPGVQLVRTRSGQGIRFISSAGQRRECIPMIWVDGQRAPGLEIDDLSVNDLEGIELYQGPSTTPMQFSQATSVLTCGTIVVWSRPPGL